MQIGGIKAVLQKKTQEREYHKWPLPKRISHFLSSGGQESSKPTFAYLMTRIKQLRCHIFQTLKVDLIYVLCLLVVLLY